MAAAASGEQIMGDMACARPARTSPQASHSMLLLVSFRAALGTHLLHVQTTVSRLAGQ